MQTISYKELTLEKIEEIDAVFWGEEDAERLFATDPDEAIEHILHGLTDDDFEGSVTVFGYRRTKASFPPGKAKWVLELPHRSRALRRSRSSNLW